MKKTDIFNFDEKEHAYTLNGRRFPSVTEIVNDVFGISHSASDFYMHKGSMLHKAISLYLQGVLDETTVDERIKGKLEGAKKAIKEFQLNPLVIETPMYHKILMYAGTPDLLTSDFIIVDWKSSHSENSEIQQGGYFDLLEHNKYKVKKGYEIVLTEEGKYKAETCDIKKGRRLFLAGLTVFNHKLKEG